MPSNYRPTAGDARDTAWIDAHPGQAVDGSSRPGYVYMEPNNQFGAPAGWISEDEYNRKYKTGLTLKQVLAMAAPLLAGGVGALAGGGAAGTLPSTSFAGAGTLPAAGGVLPSTSFAGAAALPAAAAGHGVAGTIAGAAGAAAKGAGMTFGLKDAVQFAPLVASLFGKGKVSDTPPQNDLMNQLIQMQMSQVQQSQPLRDAVMKMAMGLMPIAYQQNFPMPGATAPPATGRR
jgi:hypothetical protein